MLLRSHNIDGLPNYRVQPMLPGENNNKAARLLTRQDLEAALSPHAARDADPENQRQLDEQDEKLFQAEAHESLTSYLRVIRVDEPVVEEMGDEHAQEPIDGPVVAFAKLGLWERTYENDFSQQRLSRRAWAKAPRSMAIYALVADQQLPAIDRALILDALVGDALNYTQARLGADALLNIIIHQHDPVRDVIKSRGFEQVGKLGGVATNVPGVNQDRYQRPAVLPDFDEIN